MKKILFSVIIFFCSFFCFSLEVKTSKIFGGYNKQNFSTSTVRDLFYTTDNILLVKGYYFDSYRYFIIDCKNNIEEIDESIFLEYKKQCLEFSSLLKYDYTLNISNELIAYVDSVPQPPQIDYYPDPLFFYISNKNNENIFNFNQWKLNHEEYYPRSFYNSLSEKIFYTEESRDRRMKLNAVYTVKNKYYVNQKKNKVAIILDNYNSEGLSALIIFDILYNATVNDFKVRLRSEPNLNCQTLSYFYEGNKVKILDQTEELYEIDGESWYWYKVESGTYPVGWVYGKYLDIE